MKFVVAAKDTLNMDACEGRGNDGRIKDKLIEKDDETSIMMS